MKLFLYQICSRFLIGGLLVTLVACGSPYHEKSEGTGKESGNEIKDKKITELLEKPEVIVFDDVKRLVIDSSCVSCHNSSSDKRSGVDLSTYEALFGENSRKTVVSFDPKVSLFYETLIVESGTRHMPPRNKPQLSEEQKNLVFQWIKNGAKKEIAQIVKRPKTLSEELQPFFKDPKVIDYPVVKKYVFDRNCTHCHSYDGVKADDEAILYGQNMSSYKDLFYNDGIVKNLLEDKIVSDGEGGKKKIKGSRIYKSIATHQSMPPIQNGYQPMDSLRVKLLRLWILNCAIEDYSAISEDSLFSKLKSNGKIRKCLDPEEAL